MHGPDRRYGLIGEAFMGGDKPRRYVGEEINRRADLC